MAFSIDLGSLYVHLKANATLFNSVFDQVEQKVERTGRKMQVMGAALSIALTYPLERLAKAMTKEYAEFENQITRNMAILENVGLKTRKQYEELAISLSKQFPQTATTVAEGLFHLGQAGLNAEQAIAAMPEVMKFATAGMMGLESATELLIQSQNALGMSSLNANENLIGMTRVADALTAASVKTTASIHDFATALSNYAGQAARMVGKDVEEVIAILMAFARQGIKGEDAGYRLSMMLRDLQKASLENSRQWKELGISVYDANGEMRHVSDIIIDLEDAMDGWSDRAKKVNFMMLGFQERSLMATMALMGQGKVIKDYDRILREHGITAEQVSDKMVKSWKSQMDILWKNTLGPFRMDIGKVIADQLLSLSKIVEKFAKTWANLSDEAKRSIVIWAEVIAVMGPGLLILGTFIKTFATMAVLIKGVAVAMTGWVGVALLIAGLAYVIRAAWNQNVGGLKDLFDNQLTKIANDVLIKWGKWCVKWNQDLIDYIMNKWKRFFADWIALWEAIKKGPFREGGLGGFIKDFKETRSEVLKEFTQEPFRAIAGDLKDAGKEIGNAVSVQFKKDMEGVKDVIKSMNLSSLISEALSPGSGVESEWKQLVGWIQETGKAVKDVHVAMWEGFKGTLGGRKTGGREDKYEGLDTEMITTMQGRAREIIDTLYAGLNEKDARYFELQAERLKKNIDEWTKYASTIASKMDMEQKKVEDLIKAYEKEQKILMEIHRLKMSNDWASGFKAASMQIERDFETAGQKAYEFTMNMESIMEQGLDDMMRDWDEWEQHVTNIFKNIGYELMRIMIIRPMAQAGSQAAADIFSQVLRLWGSGSSTQGNSYADVGPGMMREALGNAFLNGVVIPMAKGYVVNQPTVFPMANGEVGLMGEAGPEAAVPLKRGPDGRLGIESYGGNGREMLGLLKRIAAKNTNPTVVVGITKDRIEEMVFEAMRSRTGREISLDTTSRYG